MSTENQVKTTPTKKQITVEEIKTLMLGGMNRKQIAAHYGAPASVINKFFKHDELKSLRPKHASEFELLDSTGKTYSPGALAHAAKEAKALEEEYETEEVAEEVAEEVTEVAEDNTPAITESTGI